MGNEDLGAVYSTRHGKLCPACGKPVAKCACKQNVPSSSSDGIVRVGRETKGRKGSGVSVISGVPLGREELVQLGKQLKKRCGSGGTVRSDGVIEIQGDHRDRLVKELEERGWVVRRSGG
jgi:translation initiation factor 1